MIADRLLQLLQDRLGFVVTRWTVVRIAGFAVLGLVVASLVLPARPGDIARSRFHELATDTTRNVSLPYGDTRGYRPTSAPGTFRVAWVGGSETVAVGQRTRAFIPQLVADRVGSVDGRSISTDVYYLSAARLVDELAGLSAALETKPDLVVVSLNPVWVLNDVAVQQWGYLDGVLAQHSAWPPSRWPVAASLVSPGDVGWKAASWVSPRAVGDRYEWGVRIARRTQDLSLLHTTRAPAPALDPLQELAVTRPVDFWFRQYQPTPQGSTLAVRQLRIMQREVESRSSFNRTVLREMLEMVDRAGVDAYFYMPPIAPQVYAGARGRGYVAEVRTMLASTSAGRTSDRVVLDPQGLQDRVPPTKFKDLVHKLDGTAEATVLSEDICSLLTRRGKDPACGRS
ncbi:MAG: hypothetical protein ACTHLJ_08385 [Angustibacter sp.]